MKLKQILALFLASQMLVTSLASCSEDTNDDKPAETSAPETSAPETEAPETEFSRASIPDELPEITFNGQDFRFIVNPDQKYELVGEDNTFDVLDEHVNARNKEIEDRFDVKISAEISSVNQHELYSDGVIMELFLAQDYQYEVCDLLIDRALDGPGNYKCFYNWRDVPYINFDKPWWNKEFNEDATINNKLWVLQGSLAVSTMRGLSFIGYNRDLFREFGLDPAAIEQSVYDGEWTIDKMIETASAIYRDNDGDGIASADDNFGLTSTWVATTPWLEGIGEKSIVLSEDESKFEVVLGNERVYSALEKLNNFAWNNKSSNMTAIRDSGMSIWDARSHFAQGKSGMLTEWMCFFETVERDFDWGVLPFPKYDTAQDRYYSAPSPDTVTCFAVPANIPTEKLDMVGVIMEAMSAETYKDVEMHYFDTILKGRYAADESVAKMIDLIAENYYIDFAHMLRIWLYGDTLYKIPVLMSHLISQNNPNLASVLAEGSQVVEDRLAYARMFWNDDFQPES